MSINLKLMVIYNPTTSDARYESVNIHNAIEYIIKESCSLFGITEPQTSFGICTASPHIESEPQLASVFLFHEKGHDADKAKTVLRLLRFLEIYFYSNFQILDCFVLKPPYRHLEFSDFS